MTNFSGTDEHQDVAESIHKNMISNETEYGLVQNPLYMHRTAANEAALQKFHI